ncbi:MAG: hypothetical protein MUP44_04660, partial [Anaerolineales bacterium]|nr:hypothetical protein [Anaerolineales bacterium]
PHFEGAFSLAHAETGHVATVTPTKHSDTLLIDVILRSKPLGSLHQFARFSGVFFNASTLSHGIMHAIDHGP